MSGRWLAGKVGGGAADARLRPRLQLLPLPGDGRPDDAARAAAAARRPEEIEKLRADYGLDKPLAGQFVDYVGDTLTLDLGISQRSREHGLGRDHRRAAVDAAAGRRRARCWRR